MNIVSKRNIGPSAARTQVRPGVRRRVRQGGFTLVEALVSAALLSLGAVSVLGAYGAINRTEAAAREMETMQRLAYEKYDEVLATSTDITQPQEGDFQDQNESRYTWSMTEDTTGVDNLDAITVTVKKANDNSSNPMTAVASGLLYVAPVTSDNPSGAAP